ncbi:MAG: hypothetical protein ACLFPE_01815 [Bacteroidales bacterium]
MSLSIEVNESKCREIAGAISPLKLRNEFYQREYLTLKAADELRFSMHFFAVAICHHTYNLYHRELQLYGWDFIEHVFVNLAKADHRLLQIDFLAKTGNGEIAALLCREFSTGRDMQSCTLDRLDERAELMKDAAVKIHERFSGSVQKIIQCANHMLIDRGNGLYETLPQFEAYADPQQKKSTFLIKLLIEAGLLRIDDPQHFIPIMDYHMQRVLLRTGCVEITDEALRERLTNREPLQSDEPVRSACIEAFRIIAARSEHPVIKLNDFFWSLGRSCCNEDLLCQTGHCGKSPCTFEQIIELKSHHKCIFEVVCKGSFRESYRALWQPVVRTHYY